MTHANFFDKVIFTCKKIIRKFTELTSLINQMIIIKQLLFLKNQILMAISLRVYGSLEKL